MFFYIFRLCNELFAGFLKPFRETKKAHITVSFSMLVALTGIEPVTRGFSTVEIAILLTVKARPHSLRLARA